MRDNTIRPNKSNEPGAKRAYASPRLRVYGDIREITRGFGDKGNKDGAGGTAMNFKSAA